MAGEAERELVKLALLAFAFELPLYLLLKNLLKRQRPVGLPVFITPSDRYSLPSGHTAAAFLMATVLAASFRSGPLAVCLGRVGGGVPSAARGALSERSGGRRPARRRLRLLALGWGQ